MKLALTEAPKTGFLATRPNYVSTDLVCLSSKNSDGIVCLRSLAWAFVAHDIRFCLNIHVQLSSGDRAQAFTNVFTCARTVDDLLGLQYHAGSSGLSLLAYLLHSKCHALVHAFFRDNNNG